MLLLELLEKFSRAQRSPPALNRRVPGARGKSRKEHLHISRGKAYTKCRWFAVQARKRRTTVGSLYTFGTEQMLKAFGLGFDKDSGAPMVPSIRSHSFLLAFRWFSGGFHLTHELFTIRRGSEHGQPGYAFRLQEHSCRHRPLGSNPPPRARPLTPFLEIRFPD